MVILFWMRICLQPTVLPFSPPEFSVVLPNFNSRFLFSLFHPNLRFFVHSPMHRSSIRGFYCWFSRPRILDVAERSGMSAFRQGLTSPSPSGVRSREASLLSKVLYMPPSSAELYHGPCLSSGCVLSPHLKIHMFIIGCSCII